MTLFGRDAANVLSAMSHSLAIIEFDPSGKILSANGNFCSAIGYDQGEIVGRHHRIFVDPAQSETPEYRAFWRKLADGEFVAGEFKRLRKDGGEIWLQASYNAVRNRVGKVYKVVKFASDITSAKREAAANTSKLDSVNRAQAVIEFKLDGEIITANDNFLGAMGYRLDEIAGRHHSMFVDPAHARSAEYADFWTRLRGGEFVANEFRRIGKGGKEIWIQASYNPIFDMNGSVVKIIKFATDVTDRVRAVRALGSALESLATGNLEERIATPFPPALEPIRISFNDSVAQLETAIGGVVVAIASIRTGLGEINTASNDLAHRTEQQAASLEETVAALGEVTQAVNETADGAGKAQTVASGARQKAEKGGEVVSRAVEAMSQIERSSAQINQIIGVIDEIAFQTNLLALNAGVEAARAGDAGRGFAVVAQEVRGLAQRSAEAAKEIKTLIATSREQVETGVELVTASGRSLEEIVTEVSSMAEVISTIAASAREQATSLREVSGAADQMDKVTQQNAAMVEEATAASQTLTNETEELAAAMAKFRTSASPAGRLAPANAARGPRTRTTTQMKATGRGGAAPAANADSESWEEF